MDSGVAAPAPSRTSTDSFASYRTPLHADFVLAHSTVAGFYSWRNTVQGSWFIQVLSRALDTNHRSEANSLTGVAPLLLAAVIPAGAVHAVWLQDLLSILTKVAQVVSRQYESNSSRQEFNNKKQIPFIYSTLTNKLFLAPK